MSIVQTVQTVKIVELVEIGEAAKVVEFALWILESAIRNSISWVAYDYDRVYIS